MLKRLFYKGLQILILLSQIYRCDTEGLAEIKPGTMLSDAECGNSTSVNAFDSFFKWISNIL